MNTKLRQIESLLNCISKEDFESTEEYRKWVVERQKQLGVKLREGADEILDRDEAKDYVARLLEAGYRECSKLPTVPVGLKLKVRNASIKDIIKEQLEVFGIYSRTQGSTQLEKESYGYLLKAKSISDLRSALNLWYEVKQLQIEEKIDEGLVNLCDNLFDELDELQHYKQVNQELIAALTYDDKQTLLAMTVHRLNAEGKGRRLIAKELDLSERKVQELLRNYEFSFSK